MLALAFRQLTPFGWMCVTAALFWACVFGALVAV